MNLQVAQDIQYVALVFALFVVPKVLQRYRVPGAITSLGLGAGAGLGIGVFVGDPTIQLLSSFGIVALFLFAGLDVEFDELVRGRAVLLQHLVIRVAALGLTAWAVSELLGLAVRPSVLVALALLTPSTGFILDSLSSMGATEQERFWIKSKAIATELVALGALFVTLQSTSPGRLAFATLILAVLIGTLPLAFRYFAARLAPYAPRSEFAFLLMMALIAAIVTRELGVYYLVGAFVVGVAAQQFRGRLPAMASEEMVRAVELFASFFVPFYFFHAGLHLQRGDFGTDALLVGAAFLATMIPFQLAIVVGHRRLALKEAPRQGLRVGLSLLPTLVFTLVLAEILRDQFFVPRAVFGGLIIYTLVNTLLPGLLLRVPPPEFEHPHAPTLDAHTEQAGSYRYPSGAHAPGAGLDPGRER